MGAGIIVSATEPNFDNRYTWLKILEDGTREWYEPADSGWVLTNTEPGGLTRSVNTGDTVLHFKNGLLWKVTKGGVQIDS